jgi:hypothetical protein
LIENAEAEIDEEDEDEADHSLNDAAATTAKNQAVEAANQAD